MKSAIAVLAMLLGVGAASAADVKSGTVLAATVRESCAAWDGADVEIKIEKIPLVIHLYHQDAVAIKEGKSVAVKTDPGNMESSATTDDKSSAIGWKYVQLKIRLNRKTRKGRIVIGKRAYPLQIHWASTRPRRCR